MWGDTLGLSECCHLLYRVTTEHGCSHGSGLTNLQIPVDNPVNMAVMDTLEDLLYAVTEDKRVMNKCRIVMEQMERKTEKKKKKKERQRREDGSN